MTAQRLLDTIARQEGFRPDCYLDSLGVWTVGIGHAITDEHGVCMTRDTCSLEQAQAMCGAPWTFALAEQRMGAHVAQVEADLRARLPWFDNLPQLVQWGLIDMCYQLGVAGVVNGFPHMIAALMGGHWDGAEAHALDSEWARVQTPQRAKEVAAWIGNHEP